MTEKVGKWLDGAACEPSFIAAAMLYGPVLKQTDLYLLGAAMQVNPVLTEEHPDIKINFNVATGDISANHPKKEEEEVSWEPYQDQPAILPRCTTVYILCRQSPWCVPVENRTGVTVKDVFSALFTFHSNEFITEDEWNALPPKTQDKIKRLAKQDPSFGGNAAPATPQWSYYHAPNQTAVRYARKAWLQTRVNLEELKVDDDYCEQRLGFKGPNVLVMTLQED